MKETTVRELLEWLEAEGLKLRYDIVMDAYNMYKGQP